MLPVTAAWAALASSGGWGVRVKFSNGGTNYLGPFPTKAEATAKARDYRLAMGSAVRSARVVPDEEDD